jgi:1-acyl-sn-glycerol-3-phosphate acyltransferase
MIEGRPGAAYLAAKLHRPIVPIGLSGTEDKVMLANLRRLRRSPILINVGAPFTLPEFSNRDRDALLKECTDEIMCRIAALIPERNRGIYARHPRLAQLLAAAQGMD